VLPDGVIQHTFLQKWCKHACVHGRRKDIFQGGISGFFQMFSRGAKSGEIYFIPLKLRKQLFLLKFSNFCPPSDQARNQLGTPGEAKSFPRGAQVF